MSQAHDDIDRIIARVRAGYCMTRSEEVHLCDHADRLYQALKGMADAYSPGFHTLGDTAYKAAIEALEACHPKETKT